MTIFERLSQILLANINDLLDQAEDPEKMLNQHVREMESQRRQAREALVEMITQEKLLEAEWAQHEHDSKKKGEVFARAKQGKDDFARASLLRYRSSLEITELHFVQLTSQKRAVSQIKTQISALESKYQRTLSQRDMLIARQRRARAQQTIGRTLVEFSLPDQSADLERINRKVQLNEAKASAYVQIAEESIDAQLLGLPEDPEIEQELALPKGGVDPLLALTEPNDTTEQER